MYSHTRTHTFPLHPAAALNELGRGESMWRIPADQTKSAWLPCLLSAEELYPNKAGLFNSTGKRKYHGGREMEPLKGHALLRMKFPSFLPLRSLLVLLPVPSLAPSLLAFLH